MNPDKPEDSQNPDDHTMSPDPKHEQDNESDDCNKHKTDAKLTHLNPTNTEMEDDLLQVEYSDNEDNSVGSTTEAMLDTDNLAESLHEERTFHRNPRWCKQISPGSYTHMHQESKQAQKGKKPKNSRDKKSTKSRKRKSSYSWRRKTKNLEKTTTWYTRNQTPKCNRAKKQQRKLKN